MEQVTYSEFRSDSGRLMLILMGIIVYCIYKMINTTNYIDPLTVLLSSALSILAVRRLILIAEKTIEEKQQLNLNSFDNLILGNIILLLLSGLSFYLFFIKGIYGMYKLIDSFSWFELLFRTMIVILSYKIVASLSRIQTVYLSIKNKNDKIKENVR
jgi:hypothetical protein